MKKVWVIVLGFLVYGSLHAVKVEFKVFEDQAQKVAVIYRLPKMHSVSTQQMQLMDKGQVWQAEVNLEAGIYYYVYLINGKYILPDYHAEKLQLNKEARLKIKETDTILKTWKRDWKIQSSKHFLTYCDPSDGNPQDLVHMENQLQMYLDYFGIGIDRRIYHLKYTNETHAQKHISDTMLSVALSYPSLSSIYSLLPFEPHELLHVIIGKDKHPLFTEGLAQAFQTLSTDGEAFMPAKALFKKQNFSYSEILNPQNRVPMGLFYIMGAALNRYLFQQFGREKYLAFYQDLKFNSTARETSALMNKHFGKSLMEIEEDLKKFLKDYEVEAKHVKSTQGKTIVITYENKDALSPLKNAQEIYLHWGYNGWIKPTSDMKSKLDDSGYSTIVELAGDTKMQLAKPGLYKVEVPYFDNNFRYLNFVFTDRKGIWDNNFGMDYKIKVEIKE